MKIFIYIIIVLIIGLFALFCYSYIYNQYRKKINRVLRRLEQPGNYGSLDKKFFTVIISCIIVLFMVIVVIYFSENKSFNYNISFYDNIKDFDIVQFENNIKKTVKAKDDYIAIYDDFYIDTDNNGTIKSVKLNLIVKKGEKYYILPGIFNNQINYINFKGGEREISNSAGLLNNYKKLSDYSSKFKRINFSNISYYYMISDITIGNNSMRYLFSYKDTTFIPDSIGIRTITTDSSISVYKSDVIVSGVYASFTIYAVETTSSVTKYQTIAVYWLQ